MKKINLLIAVLFLTMVSGFTVVKGQDFKYGITANGHRGSIVGVHDRSVGKWGAGLGVFGQIPLVENDIFDSAWLYLTGQLEYTMQGENAKVNTDLYGIQKFHHDYVAAELYLKYFFHRNNNKSDIFIFAGPKIEFLVREDRKVDPAYDLVHYKFNLDDKVKGFGYGVSFGAGLQVSQRMEAFIRYDRGFSKVYPNNNTHNTYNRLIAVGVNYYLNDSWR
ncbi:outer membrane beta-barrel protein [Candidatus Kaistella beijingensis]|uniref:outer membrane beta-barrel protein n=1 Tax=Candidatus Kaistella beijingensis TaxID=2820270 RepID=UPI001CC7F278|nr:outer membrane beta-barrel protein [Candidatus Kaistella beijingensis]UBB88554.1 outer membrane beta-barrel protein [Candidatus Kaistella beijingensis]